MCVLSTALSLCISDVVSHHHFVIGSWYVHVSLYKLSSSPWYVSYTYPACYWSASNFSIEWVGYETIGNTTYFYPYTFHALSTSSTLSSSINAIGTGSKLISYLDLSKDDISAPTDINLILSPHTCSASLTLDHNGYPDRIIRALFRSTCLITVVMSESLC